mmetsp:Transcript_10073/g.19838  ORF Transcript_10073/g.19838 Transcript_10073/m.19838 type:complete len:691 (-) Transcript_10073:44-2116(-)
MEPFESSLNSQLLEAAGEGDFLALEAILAEHNFSQTVLNEALQAAVSCCLSTSEHVQCVDALILAGANPKLKDVQSTTLLMKAAKQGQIELVRKLLEVGCDIDRRDDSQKTALLYALENDYCENVDVVKLLVEQHAAVNVKDREGCSPIHRAAERNYCDSMKILMENGAVVNSPSNTKDTPLHLAILSGHKEAASLLINKGANPNLKNSSRLSSFDMASDEISGILTISKERTYEKNKKTESKTADPAPVYVADANEEDEVADKQEQEAPVPCVEESEPYLALKVQTDDLTRQLAELKKQLEDEAAAKLRAEDALAGVKAEMLQIQFEARNKIQKLKEIERKQAETLGATRHEVQHLKAQLIEKSKQVEPPQKGKPSLLKLRIPQPYSYEVMCQSLQDDISDFISELDSWQRNVKPVYDKFVRHVSKLVSRHWEGASVEVFGSYANNLHLPTSDIDLVIVGSRGDIVQCLSELNDSLLKLTEFVEGTKFISTASVPVIKCTLVQRNAKVQIDITVQDSKHSGVACREYVKGILSKDRIIRPIFLVLKQLFYWCDCNETFRGGLSSYSLFLMITSYCQGRITGRLGEVFFGCLNYYANEFDYFSPIYAYDPLQSSAPILSPPPVQGLYIPDPLNPLSNVAHSTSFQPVWVILKYACMHLLRGSCCDCPESQSPLMRLFQDTRSNFVVSTSG